MRNFFEVDGQGHRVLRLRGDLRAQFLDYVLPRIRECYLPNERIQLAVQEQNVENVFRAAVPGLANIRSAEFAEIATYLYLPHHSPDFANANGPKKWHWKEAKDIPMKKSDVILYRCNLQNPSEADLLIGAEVKAKAVRGKTSPIGSSIEGANRDRISRMAVTLQWLKDRAILSGDVALEQSMTRFQDGVRNPYRKRFHAVSFIDSSLIPSEMAKARRDIEGIEVLIFSVPGLREVYNDIFERVCGPG